MKRFFGSAAVLALACALALPVQAQNKAMEKIRVELETNFLGTRKAEEEAEQAAEQAQAQQPDLTTLN